VALFGVLTESQITPTYGWFSPSELELVVQAIANHPNRESIIVVGGQSLVGWAELLAVPVPEVDTEYLTQDLDLLCTREDGAWLAEHLGTTFQAPTIDDATVQTGKLTYRSSDGSKLLVIDCLGAIVGPDTALVRRLSVSVQFAGWHVNLLHPLLCLESRLANLRHIASKRDGNGIAQAQVAVAVVEAYLADLVTRTPPGSQEMRAAVRRVIAMADSDAGYFCYQRWGIDSLIAISSACFSEWRYHLGKRRMHITMRRILHKREVCEAAAAKRVHMSRSARSADKKIAQGILTLLRRWDYRSEPWPGLSYRAE
jgi:hypothetical protein